MQRLTGVLRHYDWGDQRFIADLQSRPPSGRPEAELWFGAHPSAPNMLDDGRSLAQAIAADPAATLGSAVAARYGELPFLAKVLAATQPLSIQCHPSADQARAGFDRENEAGIPIDSPGRVYRDPNHKPELICALTPFEAKCGFRDLEATRDLFGSLDGRGPDTVSSRLAQSGDPASVLTDVLAWLLRTSADEGASLARTTADAAAAAAGGPFDAALDWTATIAEIHPGDVSVVVALLLNHVVLEPGQAVFLGAGNLHAYLRGAGIELMTNSDNVVRGGLTNKPVDVEEVLAVVDCSPLDPPVQASSSSTHTYDSPVTEFSLSRLAIAEPTTLTVDGPEIVLAVAGEPDLASPSDALSLLPGEAAWIPASEHEYKVAGSGMLFRATVGHL